MSPDLDIFVTTVAKWESDPRTHLALAVYWWWQTRGRVRMQDLAGIEGSQRLRYRLAYEAAKTPLYVLTDDDILPFSRLHGDGDHFWPAVEACFRADPRICLLTPFLLNENCVPRAMPETLVHRALGGCRVLRRDAVTRMLDRLGDFPPLVPDKRGAYDDTFCTALATANAGHVVEFTPWWAVHAGRDCSTFRR